MTEILVLFLVVGMAGAVYLAVKKHRARLKMLRQEQYFRIKGEFVRKAAERESK